MKSSEEERGDAPIEGIEPFLNTTRDVDAELESSNAVPSPSRSMHDALRHHIAADCFSFMVTITVEKSFLETETLATDGNVFLIF
jgi:hypothetical protein